MSLHAISDASIPYSIPAAEIPAAAASLADSFAEDPLVLHLFPDPISRPRLCRGVFALFGTYASRRGLCIASSPEMESVGLWIAPDQPPLGLWEMVRCGVLGLSIAAGFGTTRRLLGFSDFAGEIHCRHASFPHWYMIALGTKPMHRKRGLARKQAAPVLETADRENTPCFLETNNERNVRFYEALGFNVVEETTLPGTNVGHWAMLR